MNFTDGGLILNSSAAQIECFVDDMLIYTTFVYYPLRNSQEITNFRKQSAIGHSTSQANSEDKLSVMIIGMDSVSRLMFHRSLVKSRRVLEALGAIEFLGYNRVGENTFPCLIPLLTGKSSKELNAACQSDSDVMDECDFIWDVFSSQGYVTAYVEDYDDITTFNCGRKGFRKIPVDFYSKPFIKAASSVFLDATSCLGGMSEDELVLQWSLNYQKEFKNDLHFGFFWMNRFSHDDANFIQFIDPLLERIIAEMTTENLLNETVLVVVSDHGSRIGQVRQTTIGEYELNLPVLYFVFPKWYQEKYLRRFENFYENAGHRLITLFDVHRTLVDIANPGSNVDPKTDTTRRGRNLFGSISEFRSCEEAGIPKEFCGCGLNEVYLDVGSDLVRELSEKAVHFLNTLTADQRNVCEMYWLTEVIGVKALTRDDHLEWPFPDGTDFVVTLRVSPGNAIFEVVVTHVLNSSDFVVQEHVKRVNRYGDTSYCVDDNAELKPICYCKEKVEIDDVEYND